MDLNLYQQQNIGGYAIQALDKDVIKYLTNIGDFKQTGNRWTFNCDANLMWYFLQNIFRRSQGTVFRHHLNAPCPDGCLALHATSQDRCKRLIVVLYPEVENFDDLDSELRSYMVLNTYLKRDDPNFWNKLVYSMPHINVEEEPAPEAIELSVINPF